MAELAAQRRERATTVHLLAAVAERQGPASELLRQRGLDRETVLKAGRTFDEDSADGTNRVLAAAREVARRTRGTVSTDHGERGAPRISPDSKLVHVEPSALHVLVALLADRRSAAHRSLELAGIDVARLRSVAMARALGLVAARTERPERAASADLGAVRRPRGSVVSLMPASPQSQPERKPPPPRAELVRPPVPAPPSSPPPKPVPANEGQERVTRPRGQIMPNDRGSDSKKGRIRAAGPANAVPRPTDGVLDRHAFPTLAPMVQAIVIDAESFVRREHEVDRVLEVLGKHRANTPCLIGPAGVGKSTIARGVAAALAEEGRALVELPVAALVASASARGALGEKLSLALDEVRRAEGRVVVFIDDVDELCAHDEAVLELKVQLSKGGLPLLFAATTDGFRRGVESDAQLARRISAIEIEEPDEEAAFFMVRAVSAALAAHHGVTIDDEAIAGAVSWTIRYVPGRALPDKAVGVVDHACARARRAGRGQTQPIVVGKAQVAETVSELADVPVSRLLETDRERMLDLERHLAKRVVGHQAELSRISAVLRKSAAGLRSKRPLGSFLLLGPTGVGKTETAKALAEALFASSDAMTRVDMSELAEAHALARLIGAPPGYVGHDAGGQLTEAVRKRPYQVVLLDEIEKAHPEVMLAFLQVLDEGHLTDGRGRKVDFTNVVVVMTSNLGAREVEAERGGRAVGFARDAAPDTRRLADVAVGVAKKRLPLELFNRIDEILFFAPLSRSEIAHVAQFALDALADTLKARGVELVVEPGVIEVLLDGGGYDPSLGARPLKRTVARMVEAPLAELLLRGDVAGGATVIVGVEDGAIVVDAVSDARPRALGATA
jgi:ATP-dependent Clp protease ATP-binding subunit ClpC